MDIKFPAFYSMYMYTDMHTCILTDRKKDMHIYVVVNTLSKISLKHTGFYFYTIRVLCLLTCKILNSELYKDVYSVILTQAMGYLIRELALYFIPIFGQSISATWQHLVTLFLVMAWYWHNGLVFLFKCSCGLYSSIPIAVVRLSASAIATWSLKSFSVIYMSGFFSFSVIKWSGPNKKYPLVHFSSHVLLLALPSQSSAGNNSQSADIVNQIWKCPANFTLWLDMMTAHLTSTF